MEETEKGDEKKNGHIEISLRCCGSTPAVVNRAGQERKQNGNKGREEGNKKLQQGAKVMGGGR